MKAKADCILKTIDPIIGVAGKDAEVTFNLTPSLMEVSISDESKSALCRMSIDVPQGMNCGDIADYAVGSDMSVTVNIDLFAAALKVFGTQTVDITAMDSRMVIENESGRRTLRTLSVDTTSKAVRFSKAMEIVADTADLRKCAGFDGIGESVCFNLHLGQLSIGVSSDNESAEVFIDADVYCDHRSFYSAKLFSDLVKRIHTEDAGVTISLSDDAPMIMDFSYRCAQYYIFVAPRIEAV